MLTKNLILAMAPLSILSSCSAEKEESRKPNVIIVMTDDQGYGDLACHGNEWINTPNLDNLHSQSVRLTDFHVSPTSAPTRAALLTGHYSNRTGVWHTIGGRSLIKEGEITLAEVLKDNGYSTGIFGKWHLGDNYPFRPQDRGFEEVLIHKAGGVTQMPDYWDNDYFDDTYYRNGVPEKTEGFCTDVWFNNAMDFMRNSKEKPFFAYIVPNAPHGPFNVADKYVEPYKDNELIPNPEFYGLIANFDENMGRLMEMLDDNEIADNTILIFLTDNGTAAGAVVGNKSDGFVTKGFNAGMRGKKSSMYEGGHRVPFYIRWPKGGISGGSDIDELTAHVDLMPTLIDMLDLEFDPNYKFDGESIANLLTGKVKKKDRMLIVDSQRIQMPEKWRRSSVMSGKWRLVNGKELYDLSTDPGQKTDVSEKHPEKVAEMRKFYEEWWADLSPEFSYYPEIIIGSDKEKLTMLTSHDIQTESVAWNQRQVRDGMVTRGKWTLKVEEKGMYRFALRRWPMEVNAPIVSAIEKRPALEGTSVPESIPGEALEINSAVLGIAGLNEEIPVSAEDTEVVFTVELDEGPVNMEAYFTTLENKNLSAYYVYVNKIR